MSAQSINKKRVTLSLIAALALVAVYLPLRQGSQLIVPAVNASPLRPLTAKEQNEINAMRPAGLHGDRSQVSTMLGVLRDPTHPHPVVINTALHSLASLGVTAALPDIDNLIQSEGNSDVGNYAKVAKARLIAENNAVNITGSTAQSAVKISRFYKELGLTSNDLNSETAIYYQQEKERHIRSYPPIEVYAMREIADMVYHGSYADFAALPRVAQVNFALDYPSALKMQFAPLSRTNRINALVRDLARKQYMRPEEKLEMQLVADEGLAAGPVASAELREMDAHRDQYPREGFKALFGVLDCVGDKAQAPLMEHFQHDSDDDIASYARGTYESVHSGKKGQIMPNY